MIVRDLKRWREARLSDHDRTGIDADLRCRHLIDLVRLSGYAMY
jgi:hypothetical protein